MHRAISLTALSALGTHIMLEIIAHRARAVNALVPFLAFPARGDREDLVVTEAWISQISGVREISG
jgi:hypothetical protein